MDTQSILFEPLRHRSYVAEISTSEHGLMAAYNRVRDLAPQLGLYLEWLSEEGALLEPGTVLVRMRGPAEAIVRGEEHLLGLLGKPCGIATASFRFVWLGAGRVRIICGAWRRIAREFRTIVRDAIGVGGAGVRLDEEPYVYLDKNFVRMFGGIGPAVRHACTEDGRTVAVQLRGDSGEVAAEAAHAFSSGARILVVDTGRTEDLKAVVERARRDGFRDDVRIAFSGGVTATTLDEVIASGADIVDIGRAIVDAPLLDLRFDVVREIED